MQTTEVIEDVSEDCTDDAILARFREDISALANVTRQDQLAQLYCLAGAEQRRCFLQRWTENPPLYMAGEFCEPHWDNVACWPATAVNETSQQPCPIGHEFDQEGAALRQCRADGSWGHSDYLPCVSEDYIHLLNESTNATIGSDVSSWQVVQANAMKDIYFYGSCASLLMLFITLVIFCWLRSLHCARVHIHKNLVISLMLHCILTIVYYEPYVITNGEMESYLDKPILCKTFTALVQYTFMTNVYWTFVEGLYMYCNIAVAVFSRKTPYVIYHLIGWGFPALCAIAWTVCMSYSSAEHTCWRHYSRSSLHWIIIAPVVSAVAANMFFLVNVIKVLVTKLNSACSTENRQIRKAMKATGVLLPLLSITNVLFVTAPSFQSSPETRVAYSVTNAVLQTTQGMLVATLYCFFNGEVRAALVRRLKQLRERKRSYKKSSPSSPAQTDILLKKCISASTVTCIPNETGSCFISSDNGSTETRSENEGASPSPGT